ncbi:MAG: hypothetical protein ACOCYG_03290 [Spirochaetota bacterium]
MAGEADKAQAFVARLLQNPAMAEFTPLQKEEQIIQFLNLNAGQLAPTLTHPSFFPGKSWSQIQSLLLQSLYRQIDQSLLPQLEQMLKDRVAFTFVQFLRQQNISSDRIREQVLEVLKQLLTRPDGRRALTGPYTAVYYDLADKYVDAAYLRRSYVHFEFTKVQRLKMSKEEVKNFVQVSMILKPTVVLSSSASAGQQKKSVAGTIPVQYAERAFGVVQKQLSLLPDPVLKSAINANISFTENRFVEATARMAAVFAARGKNYRPQVKVDRGADTPDKSWLSIARRNYKFYGFDAKMVDELYSVAAENGW